MARKLVASAGLGEIFSADDFFIDLAGRYVASGNTSSMLFLLARKAHIAGTSSSLGCLERRTVRTRGRWVGRWREG